MRGNQTGPQGESNTEDKDLDDDLDLNEDEDEDASDDEDQDDLDEDEDEEQDVAGISVEDLAKSLVPQLASQIKSSVESAVDRRINVVLKEVRGQKAQKQTSGGRQVVNQAPAAEPDVRGARLALRDYLGDHKFTSAQERKFALELGSDLIKAKAFDGFDDEDAVGREVAEKVIERVTGVRKHYVAATKRSLQRKGVLNSQEGQAPGSLSGKGTGWKSEFDKGAERAKARHSRSS